MIFYKPITINTWLFLLLIFSSVFSYADNHDIQKITYITAFISLLGLLLLWPIESYTRFYLVGGFCGLMLIFTLLPFSISDFPVNIWSLVQPLGYPAVAFLLLMVGWRIVLLKTQPLALGIILVSTANAVVGIMASLGFLSTLPVLGEVEIGRVIFGTSFPSSSGLFNNVNYYSTAQGIFFWLYWWITKNSKAHLTVADKLFLCFILATSFIGSSRGVVIALLASMSAYFVISLLEVNTREKVIRLSLVLICFIIASGAFVSYYDVISEAFRINKGLNNRDVIWSAVNDLWRSHPILGHGSIESISSYIESSTGTSSSIQSAYLMTLARGGILLFMTMYGLIIACVLFGLGTSRNLWVEQKIPVAILIYWLVSMTVRTFSLGGLGFLPVIGGIALSNILYAKHVRNMRNRMDKGYKPGYVRN